MRGAPPTTAGRTRRLARPLADAVAQIGDGPVTAVRQDLGELRLAVDRAGRLVSKLLDFARRPDGQDEVADVSDAIDTVENLIARSLDAGVELVVEVEPFLPPVSADPVKLERVLVNLVINARDAITDTGTVTIRAGAAPNGQVGGDRRDRAASGATSVIVEVADDGRGMPQSIQAWAFDPLFTTKGEAGSGLGLSTVAAFADLIDGSIQLDSAPGRGTRVLLTIPFADQPVQPVPVGIDVPVGGARVLLVDPGERTRRVITQMLQGAGYRVRAVGSAEDAFEALAETPADLLITELALSGMPGVRLLDEVAVRYPQLRTVALATVDAPRTLDDTPVLVKPFIHTRLLRTVERAMQGR